MKVFNCLQLLFVFVLAQAPANAVWDYNAEAVYRSTPSGANLAGQVGKSFLLWGNRDSFHYGYSRLSLYASSVAVVSTYDLRLEIFPISILGIELGVGKFYQNYEGFDMADCSENVCRGQTDRKYIGLKTALSHSHYYIIERLRYTVLDVTEKKRPYYDSFSSLFTAPGEDKLFMNTLVFGKEFSPQWSAGIISVFNKMYDANSTNHMLLSNICYSVKKMKYVAALGYFNNQNDIKNLTFFFKVTWNGAKGMQLF